jgi:hypothetical protein
MIYEYSNYAKNTIESIQFVNDNLQSILDEHYSNFDTSDDIDDPDSNRHVDIIINERVLDCVDILQGIVENYYNNIKDYYESVDDDDRFNVPFYLRDTIYEYLDIIYNFETLSEATSDSIMKLLNINSIYDVIVADISGAEIHPDESEDSYQLYTSENILDSLDVIFSDFYEWIDAADQICTKDSTVFTAVKYYIFELWIVSYIIEFVESIEPR